MSFDSFEEFQAEVNSLHLDGHYFRALELILNNKERFPSRYGLINYWLISLYSLTGDTRHALKTFGQTLSSGFWFSDFLLRKNPDLQSLQGLEQFEGLVALNRENRTLDESHKFPLLILRSESACLSSAEPCPILLVIHSYAATAADSLDFWRAASEAGYLVAAPQSSQALWKGAYIWDDLETSTSEIVGHLQSIQDKYEIDPEHIIISGIRKGAELCVKLALSGTIQAKGFILINPDFSFMYKPDPFNLENQTNYPEKEHEGWNLRGYIINGENTASQKENLLEAFTNSMLELGIVCNLDYVPNAAYEHIPGYDPFLLRAIDFISQD